MTPVELLVQNINDGFTRMRALLFIMMMFCAALLSHIYIQSSSYHEAQTKLTGYIVAGLADLKSNTSDSIEQARIDARIKRMQNTLDDFKFETIDIPIIGLKVPVNDFAIIIGGFLCALGFWIIPCIRQLREALSEPELLTEIKEYIPALRHSAIFIYPTGRGKALVAFGMFCLPALTLIIETYTSWGTLRDYDLAKYLEPLKGALSMRLAIELAYSLFLVYVAFRLIKLWLELNAMFYGGNRS